MAVSFTAERVETVSTANATTYDSASFTPTANSLLILCTTGGDSAATFSLSTITTVSGTSLTWNLIQAGAELNDGVTWHRRSMYYAIAPSSTAATVIRVTWSEAIVGCHIWIGEFAGFDTGAPIAQSAVTTLASGTETHSLAGAVDANSMTVYMNACLRNPPAWDASGDGWTEDMDNGANTPALGMFVAHKANDQTITFTGTNIESGSIIAEIEPAPAPTISNVDTPGAFTFTGSALPLRGTEAVTAGAITLTGATDITLTTIAPGVATVVDERGARVFGAAAPFVDEVGRRVIGTTNGLSEVGAFVWDLPVAGGTTTVNVTTPGAVTFTGSTVGLRTAIAPTPGAVTWASAAPVLTTRITPTPGAVTWTGSTIGLRGSIAPTPGAVTWAGSTIALRNTEAVSPGAVTFTGSTTITLVTTGTTTVSVTTPGAITFTGSAVGLRTAIAPTPGALGIASGTPSFDDLVTSYGANLIARWKLDEPSGTAVEDYGTGTDADGTYVNTPTLAVSGPSGVNHTAVRFNGTDEYVEIPWGAGQPKLDISGSFTILAVVKYASGPSTLGPVFSEAYSGGADPVSMTLSFDTTGGDTTALKPVFGWFNGATFKLAVSPDDLTADAWHLFGGVYSASGTPELRVVIDGVTKDTEVSPGTQPTGTNDRRIARRWDTGGTHQYFAGDICEVLLFDTVLSDAQQLALYNAALTLGTGAVRLVNIITPTPGAITLTGSTGITLVTTGSTVVNVDVAGAVLFTGSTIGLRTSITPTPGAVTWTGSTTITTQRQTVTGGAIALTGQTTPLRTTIANVGGAITWTGSAIPLRGSIAPTPGAITWTGSTVGLRTAIAPTPGAVTFTGAADIVLTTTGSTVSDVTVPGAITFTGSTIALRTAIALVGGAVTWTGSTVGLRTAINTVGGAVTFAGQTVLLTTSVGVAPGVLTWTGATDIVLISGGTVEMVIDVGGAITYTGTTTAPVVNKVTPTPGVATFTGSTGITAGKAAIVTVAGAVTFLGRTTPLRSVERVTGAQVAFSGQQVELRTLIRTGSGAIAFTGSLIALRKVVTPDTGAVTLTGSTGILGVESGTFRSTVDVAGLITFTGGTDITVLESSNVPFLIVSHDGPLTGGVGAGDVLVVGSGAGTPGAPAGDVLVISSDG